LELVCKAGYKILYAGGSSKFGDSGLILVGENDYGDEFSIRITESFLILEITQLFGGEIEMLLERKGNRMTGSVISYKTFTLGWSLKKNLANFL
jgi:UDP-glucose 4-epimerase